MIESAPGSVIEPGVPLSYNCGHMPVLKGLTLSGKCGMIILQDLYLKSEHQHTGIAGAVPVYRSKLSRCGAL